MRVSPTVNIYTGGTLGSVRNTSTGAVVSMGTIGIFGAQPVGFAFWGSTNLAPLVTGGHYDFTIVADAEL